MPFSVAVPSRSRHLATETLSATSPGEVPGQAAVRSHIHDLTLAPNMVAALETSPIVVPSAEELRNALLTNVQPPVSRCSARRANSRLRR